MDKETEEFYNLMVEIVGTFYGIKILMLMEGKPLEELSEDQRLSVELNLQQGILLTTRDKAYENIKISSELSTLLKETTDVKEHARLEAELGDHIKKGDEYIDTISKLIENVTNLLQRM